MNRPLSITMFLSLLTANAAGAVEDPKDQFSPQTIGRQAVSMDGDDVIVNIDATKDASTMNDGKYEVDIVVGTEYGEFVQSQRGAKKIFTKKSKEVAAAFAQLTRGDRSKHPTTAFRTVGAVDGDYESRISFSSTDAESGEANFKTLADFKAMEQQGKYLVLLTKDGSSMKFFDATKLAEALSLESDDVIDDDKLVALNVTEEFALDIETDKGHKLVQKIDTDGSPVIQVLNDSGVIIAHVNAHHKMTPSFGQEAPDTYDVALQSGKGNAKIRYNPETSGAELAEPLEIAA